MKKSKNDNCYYIVQQDLEHYLTKCIKTYSYYMAYDLDFDSSSELRDLAFSNPFVRCQIENNLLKYTKNGRIEVNFSFVGFRNVQDRTGYKYLKEQLHYTDYKIKKELTYNHNLKILCHNFIFGIEQALDSASNESSNNEHDEFLSDVVRPYLELAFTGFSNIELDFEAKYINQYCDLYQTFKQYLEYEGYALDETVDYVLTEFSRDLLRINFNTLYELDLSKYTCSRSIEAEHNRRCTT